MNHNKAVIFDLDDTLYPENKYIKYAYYDIAKILSRDFNYNEKELLEKMLYFRKEYGDSTVLQRIMLFLNISNAHDYIHQVLVPAYRTCKCELNLFSDARELIRKLEGKVKLGLITNGGKDTQLNKIKLLKLENLFDVIIITGEHFEKMYWKPHSKPFELCLRKLNISPPNCVYVGNNPVYDVEGAAKLGIKVFIRNLKKDNKYSKKKLTNSKYIEVDNLLQVLDDCFFDDIIL